MKHVQHIEAIQNSSWSTPASAIEMEIWRLDETGVDDDAIFATKREGDWMTGAKIESWRSQLQARSGVGDKTQQDLANLSLIGQMIA